MGIECESGKEHYSCLLDRGGPVTFEVAQEEVEPTWSSSSSLEFMNILDLRIKGELSLLLI